MDTKYTKQNLQAINSLKIIATDYGVSLTTADALHIIRHEYNPDYRGYSNEYTLCYSVRNSSFYSLLGSRGGDRLMDWDVEICE